MDKKQPFIKRRMQNFWGTKRFYVITIVLGSIFMFSVGYIRGKKHGILFMQPVAEYSIGIYSGNSPLNLKSDPRVKNPVISAKDITDAKARFVADPFLMRNGEKWYLFFEVLDWEKKSGQIGCAESPDGLKWKYLKIVLKENFHLSYPYVFKVDNEIYMIPESHEAYAVRLYRAVDFPYKWEYVKDLVRGDYSDPGVVKHGGYWYLFTSDRNDILHLFFSKDFHGPWTKHPKSPVVFLNSKIARLGGRVVDVGDTLLRFTQDCSNKYGELLNVMLVTKLTPQDYSEIPFSKQPFLRGSGKGWNAQRMHQCDPEKINDTTWIASVDGVGSHLEFGFNY
jgi:hypothetical protein